MNKILHILLVFLFSLTIISCGTDDGGSSSTTTSTTSTTTTTTDTTAPTVISVSTTADNQSSVSITDNITVTFSEAMDTTYVTTSTSDTNCAGTIRVSSDNFSSCVRMSSEPVSSNSNKTFTLDPYDNLTVGTTYLTRITTGVKDTAGNALSSQYDNSTGFAPVDLTAPTASVTTATITTSENAVVQSTETGTAYLVNTAVTVSNLASITGAADNQSNSITISSAATNTNLPATGLADGTYKVYAVDATGNLSSASSNSVTLLIDYALDFDGTNDNVSANGTAVTLNTSNNTNSLPLSVSAWVYPDNGTKDQLIFGLYKNSTFINGPSVWYGDNDTRFSYYDKITSSISSSNTYAINNWHHVVLTIGDNRSGVLYVNGSSALTISAANGEGGLDMFSIGVDYDAVSNKAGNPAQYFDGKIDEVAVWNDKLTSAEVTAIYNSGNMLNVSSNSGNYASAANLQGYYRFNEGSGTSLQDNSSNSNTGTVNGAIWTAGFVSK